MTETFRPAVREGRSYLLTFLMILITGVLLLVGGLLVRDLYGALTMRYEVTGDTLLIHYGFRTERIPLDLIDRTWILHEPTALVRRAGTSTAGLKSGRWSARETGPLILYATRVNDLLIVETSGGKVGLSPGDPDGLQRAVADGAPASFLPAGDRSEAVRGMLFPFFLIMVVMVGGIGTIRYVARFPQQLRYELGSDLLTIQTGWRPVRIPLDQIERVEIAEPKGYPLRLYGSHAPGILWGRFTWRQAGQNLSLYATQARPLVLLHLRGNRTVGISPAEGETFVTALAHRIG